MARELTDSELHAVLDLLARIHSDGGHYVNEHGLEKACRDAEDRVVQLLRIADYEGLNKCS